MTPSTPSYLRIYSEQPAAARRANTAALEGLPAVLEAFGQATGWSLRYIAAAAPESPAGRPSSIPVNPGQGIAPGHLKLEAGKPKRAARLDEAKAQALASALATLLAESSRTQHALWQREAELAAGVPLVSAPDGATQLAQRLEEVLKGGARAIGCHAAALYLLDEATSSLKLRSCWGLPRARLADEARPLRGSVADLEALLGSAVVLDDPLMMKHWKVPEEFPAAVCVPVGTSATILGTLWIFSKRQRTFNDRQTNIIEVIAGRLAADLEREMLLREGVDGAHVKRQLGAAERFQRDQLPSVAPPIDGWDLAGWVAPAQQLTGNFFDWFARPDATVGVTLGEAAGTPAEAALSAGGLKMALRCHGRHESRPQEILELVNGTIWSGSAGGQSGSACVALLRPDAPQIALSTAGRVGLVCGQAAAYEVLTQVAPPIGQSPDARFPQREVTLQPGQALLVASTGLLAARDGQGRAFGETGLGQTVAPHAGQSAQRLAMAVRDAFDAHHANRRHDDAALLVISRRGRRD